MRRALLLLTLAALLGAALPTAAQPPAAVPNTTQDVVSHCQKAEVTRYVTAGGNVYTVDSTMCLAQVEGSPTFFAPHGRYDCRRNGALWDGCRFDTTMAIRYRIDGGNIWVTDSVSDSWHYPASGWVTTAAHTGQFRQFDLGEWDIRGAQNWGAAVRIRLADNTTVLRDMLYWDSVIWF